MEWSNESTLQFLEAFQAEAVLWDRTHEYHKDKTKVHSAWSRLSTEFNLPVAELKKKKDSLMGTFRGYLRKKKTSIASGASMEDIYKPVWFAYDYMEEFLSSVYDVPVTQNANTDNLAIEFDITNDAVDEGTGCVPVPMTSQKGPGTQRENPPSARRQLNSPGLQSNSQNSPALQEAENQMWEAFTMSQNNESIKSEANEKEEDECDLYGKLLAKKLRKLPEEEREILMYEIDGILLNRRQKLFPNGTMPSRMDSRPSSVASTST